MHRRSRISRVEAEQLLAHGVGGPEALAALLAAATPPVAAGEVLGEQAALSEFRAARLSTDSPRRRLPLLKSVLGNLAAAKVALAAAAAAAATGGVALAAASGSLPGTSHAPEHAPPFASVSATESASAPSTAASSSTEPAPQPSESESAGTASPSPSLDGLCKAYQAGATDNPGKALQNPAFSVLVAAAGGADKVADFCVARVGPAPTHHAGAPSQHAAPTTHPHGAPATHPSGPPETRPTSVPAPSEHP